MSAKQVKKVKKVAKPKPKKKVAKKVSAKKASAKKVTSKKTTAKKAVKKAAPKSEAKKTTIKKVKAKKAAKAKTSQKKNTTPKKETTKKQVAKKKTAPKPSSKATEPAKTIKTKPTKKKVLTSTHKNLVKKATPEIKPAKKSKKSRYSEKELEYFQKLIDKKLVEAREQLEFYIVQIKNIGSDPDSKLKGLEDGTSTSENEKAYALAARQRKYIHHLENAKLRIKNKVYGVCRVTGNLISKARLKAVPHATLSIGAKLNG